ncbi:hypothetical protein KSP39_PZI016874 [Platanthera zijinensis]|uniref:RanBP2-type domain-containing protein n=1 Tax=Platanthera zijinensis TaxID=2320716 RepID=A0AAP0B5Y4_9ASPA
MLSSDLKFAMTTPPTFHSSLSQANLSLRRFFHFFCCRRHSSASKPRLDFLREEIQVLKPLKRIAAPPTGRTGDPAEKEEHECRSVEISHQWPEWVDLMDHLLKKGYLEHGAFQSSSSPYSSSKDSNQIRTACLNFARENSQLIRYLSRNDIRIVVGSGCPSLDRKVVNSGKRLRAYVGTNEGEVCSSCKLRGNCERAYVKPSENETGRTMDVMRILLTYGFNTTNSSVEDGLSLGQTVKESVRRLLNDVVDHSLKNYGPVPKDEKSQINVLMKQGDWICPKCSFLNFAKNIRCLRCTGVFQERLAKLREDGHHLPLKKGDWICEKCNFFNFAKNVKCVQCNEKPTNRLLNPGEWECESCNYINFRKNFYCLKCGWKRPKAACTEHGAGESESSKHQHDNPSDPTLPHFLRTRSLDFRSSPKYSFCEGADTTGDGMPRFKSSAEFHEFPVVGGKSAISKDRSARDRWKEDMLSRKKGMASWEDSRKNDDKALSSPSFEIIASEECGSDEDDIAGWFKE